MTKESNESDADFDDRKRLGSDAPLAFDAFSLPEQRARGADHIPFPRK
jgi:hypothetical protein